jgi:hypothetical protein
MAWLAFYYLLRPGEYCRSREGSPVCLADVAFTTATSTLTALAIPLPTLPFATHSTLTFGQQKNRNRGEVVGHGRSGHPFACPTAALARRVLHLRQHHAPPTTLLCTAYCPTAQGTTRPVQVTNALLTRLIRSAIPLCPPLGYQAPDVNARSLRAGGAMALLCGGVTEPVIRLLGRWQSDSVFRYLHAQTIPVLHQLATTMFQHGAYTLLPSSGLPPLAHALLDPAHLETLDALLEADEPPPT